MKSKIMPVIKKVIPNLVANSLVGVQPMTGPTGQIFTLRVRDSVYPKNFFIISDIHDVPEGYCIVQVSLEVMRWIEEQDIALWKPVDDTHSGWRYCIANKLFTIMALRWS